MTVDYNKICRVCGAAMVNPVTFYDGPRHLYACSRECMHDYYGPRYYIRYMRDVGNTVQFYKRGACGYTEDLNSAETFTELRAKRLVDQRDDGMYKAYQTDEVKKIARTTVNCQLLKGGA